MNARLEAAKWALDNHPNHDVRIAGNEVKAMAECLDCEQGKTFGDPSDVFEAVESER